MIWISFSLLKWGVQRHTSFFKKTVDDLRKMCYHKCTAKAVCGYGGIGRRAWFRSMWGQLHAGSTPVIRIKRAYENRSFGFYKPFSRYMKKLECFVYKKGYEKRFFAFHSLFLIIRPMFWKQERSEHSCEQLHSCQVAVQ